MQDTGLGVLVHAVFEYLDPFLQSFDRISLPHVKQTVNDLKGGALPIGRHASQGENTSRGRGVGNDGQAVNVSEGENHKCHRLFEKP